MGSSPFASSIPRSSSRARSAPHTPWRLRPPRPASGSPGSVHGFYKAGFAVKDLDRTLAELTARGVEVAFGPFPAKDGRRANAILRDNAGNLIQVFGN